jgi:hypothetical protein
VLLPRDLRLAQPLGRPAALELDLPTIVYLLQLTSMDIGHVLLIQVIQFLVAAESEVITL